ncbi:hypothetical protein [Laspinema palackyanum]|uniref:hypothetical protein n=1 Tax=Laspinema palackyanum TaxID=3231601 RepID=UPI00345DAF2B|nr:hypothetical protein [Laspinema sp. D2c]
MGDKTLYFYGKIAAKSRGYRGRSLGKEGIPDPAKLLRSPLNFNRMRYICDRNSGYFYKGFTEQPSPLPDVATGKNPSA